MEIKWLLPFRNKVMQLSSNFYDLHCYGSDFIYNNQFLANFEMSQSLHFLMNISNTFKTDIGESDYNWIHRVGPKILTEIGQALQQVLAKC